jgi:hypothetical protein
MENTIEKEWPNQLPGQSAGDMTKSAGEKWLKFAFEF